MTQKKSIEAVALGSALIVTIGSTVLPMDADAATGTACSLSTTGIGSTISGDASSFLKVSFTARCSPNTVVTYNDSGTASAVKGGSKKGNIFYGSTSEGGGGAVWCNSPSTYTDASSPANTAPANGTDGCS